MLVETEDVAHTADAVQKIFEDGALRMKLRNNGMITVHEKFDVKRTAIDSEIVLSLVKTGGVPQ